jgi:uncharacterized membrane protein YgdD (TMEM256/DUF423 family)
MTRVFMMFGGALGFLAVLAGAFGAHGLEERLSARDLAIWEVAAHYQLAHAGVLFAVAWACERFRSQLMVFAGWFLLGGIALFCGSLYLLAVSELLTGTRQAWLGMVAPLGGLSFMGGWLCLFIGAFLSRKPAPKD